jgi:O-methyltransferase
MYYRIGWYFEARPSMADAPEQKYRTLRKFIPKVMQPYLRGLRKRFLRNKSLAEPYRSIFPYTQVHPVRQENLARIGREIEERLIPGAIVECGVLDGGTAALMGFATKDRPIHLFDSWEGLPDTSEKDGDAKMWAGDVVGSPRRVVSVFKALRVDLDRVIFHKGWFDSTFPKAKIPQIALLHIDADFYESVRLALETWEPCVSPGGYIQIDDYSSFIGCRRAVDEYLVSHPTLTLRTFAEIAYFIQKPL